MAMTRSYTQSPSSEVVQDVMNSTTFNPISLISNFLDSYVQEHQVTSMAPRSQTENTEKAHSKATGKKPQGRKRTKTGCLSKFLTILLFIQLANIFFSLSEASNQMRGRTSNL